MQKSFEALAARARRISPSRPIGRVVSVSGTRVRLAGLSEHATIGDHVEVCRMYGEPLRCEVVELDRTSVDTLADGLAEGIRVGAAAFLTGPTVLMPCDGWIGRVIDPDGRPLDGRYLPNGPLVAPLRASPPPPTQRRGLGKRLESGIAAFNTFLPIARGQRIGLFAGSGVGKSTLLGMLARRVESDVVVVALIGERGREVGEFVRDVLGQEGLGRSVVIAAPADGPPLTRRRCAWSAMAVAEHFRDQGKHVLLLADSVTRFVEAHRDAALSIGEHADSSGFPPSFVHQVTSLCERAGTGTQTAGDITAIFTVLVQKSDMDGPVADVMRGVLDGHVILDREIAERGRFPAINMLKSVSRSLPNVATPKENAIIFRARTLLGLYTRAELMIQSGLYTAGHDFETDTAINCWPKIDAFIGRTESETIDQSFNNLENRLDET